MITLVRALKNSLTLCCLLLTNISIKNEIINADLLKISEWFKANKLTVNPSKSNIIITTFKPNKPSITFEIFLNRTFILQTTIANYLGIITDSNLKFHHHILSLCGASAIPSVFRWLICIKLLETLKNKKKSNIR